MICIVYKNITEARKRFKNLNYDIIKIRPINSYEEGSEARFYPISKHVGVKIWTGAEPFAFEYALAAYSNQIKAHSHRVGPKVLSPVDTVLVLDEYGDVEETAFGYKTQIAQKIGNTKKSEKIYGEQVDALYLKMKSLGMEFFDIGYDNCGIINGKLVCIDFGSESIS